jgi:membrane protein implicated in regulation of membrane protease activity
MLTVYIICAILGGGLIVLGAMGGDHSHGGDHDFTGGHDFDHGPDFDHSHDAGQHDMGSDGPWIPFLSLRFWTYFIGTFGATGLLLSHFADTVEPTTAMIAGGTGIASGLVAAAMVRWISRNEADSTARERDLLGLRAKVTVPIREGSLGRIRTTVKGELLDLLANAEQPVELPENSEVVIVGMEGGRATVMPLDAILEESK